MYVVIFCDMEGISCIEHWDQVTGGKALYEECRKLYTDEMNAAVRGARAAGASRIEVVDCHGAGGAYSFKSFIPERLEAGAQYIFGYPWARYITPFEQGCDAILFLSALMPWPVHPTAYSATPSPLRHGITPRSMARW